MNVLEYMIAAFSAMLSVSLIGRYIIKPIIFVKNKVIIALIWIVFCFAWGMAVDIFKNPIKSGVIFGFLLGLINLFVDCNEGKDDNCLFGSNSYDDTVRVSDGENEEDRKKNNTKFKSKKI